VILPPAVALIANHRDDTATKNSFSIGEREVRSSGGFTLKEGGAQ